MKMAFGLILSLFLSPAVSFGGCPDIPVKTFAKDFAKAYATNKLGSLDDKYANLEPINVFIEHSIAEEDNGKTFFITSVQTFRELAKLLQSRQSDGLPAPQARPLRKCANSVCTYDFLNGIQHNKLYLKEIRYNDYKSCLEIESIWFLDGD